MIREEPNSVGVLSACLFCGMSVLSIAGWTYLFLNETYPNLSPVGVALAIGLGIGLAPLWLMSAVYVAVLVLSRQWKARPVWIGACVVAGLTGGLVTLVGWAMYLGPAV